MAISRQMINGQSAHSLLSLLLDCFEADAKKQQTQAVTISIQRHLAYLLNTRKGTLSYDKEYGMPDLTVLYTELPYSLDDLIDIVKNTIEKYEPRLTNVCVTQQMNQRQDCVLCLAIKAQIKPDKNICFATFLLSGGCAKVAVEELCAE